MSYRIATTDELQDIAYRQDTQMRPRFEIDGDTVDAPVRTLVFVDPLRGEPAFRELVG